MPIKHLRVCIPCDRVRFAACSIACRVPHDGDKDSWLLNMQTGAGTFPDLEETA